MVKSEKYLIADILDEDLEVTRKWLIKASIIEDEDEDENLVSRELVFDLIAEIVSTNENAMELGFEVAKLPTLHLTREQQRTLRREGVLKIDIYKSSK